MDAGVRLPGPGGEGKCGLEFPFVAALSRRPLLNYDGYWLTKLFC